MLASTRKCWRSRSTARRSGTTARRRRGPGGCHPQAVSARRRPTRQPGAGAGDVSAHPGGEIFEGSSWSCAHGIERWRSDCGCSTSGQPGWKQQWRAPLRDALDGLRDQLAAVYEQEAGKLLRDPWRARDEFIEVLLDPERRNAPAFLARHAIREPGPEERVKALQLLEMQRQTQLMYTSCGWFFAEVSGLETVQILKYAARALQLAREACGVELEASFKAALERAPRTSRSARTRGAYTSRGAAQHRTLETVAAHYAIAGLVEDFPRRARIFCHDVQTSFRRREDAGTAALSVARIEVKSLITQEQLDSPPACCTSPGRTSAAASVATTRIARSAPRSGLFESFNRLSLAQVVREIDREFPGREYTLRDLFLDERREVAGRLLQETMARYEGDYLQTLRRQPPAHRLPARDRLPGPTAAAGGRGRGRHARGGGRGPALAAGKLDPGLAQESSWL